jgi:hypothetical protein
LRVTQDAAAASAGESGSVRCAICTKLLLLHLYLLKCKHGICSPRLADAFHVGRYCHTGQHCDDCYHHHQLNQREPGLDAETGNLPCVRSHHGLAVLEVRAPANGVAGAGRQLSGSCADVEYPASSIRLRHRVLEKPLALPLDVRRPGSDFPPMVSR